MTKLQKSLIALMIAFQLLTLAFACISYSNPSFDIAMCAAFFFSIIHEIILLVNTKSLRALLISAAWFVAPLTAVTAVSSLTLYLTGANHSPADSMLSRIEDGLILTDRLILASFIMFIIPTSFLFRLVLSRFGTKSQVANDTD